MKKEATKVPTTANAFVKGFIFDEVKSTAIMEKLAEEAKINIKALCNPYAVLFETPRLYDSERRIDDTDEEFYDPTEKINIIQTDVYVALIKNQTEGYLACKHIFVKLDNGQTYYTHLAAALNKEYDFTLSNLREESEFYEENCCDEKCESNMKLCRRWRPYILSQSRAEKIQTILERMAFWMHGVNVEEKSVYRDELRSEISRYEYDDDDVFEKYKRKFFVNLEYNSNSSLYMEYLNRDCDDGHEYRAINYHLSEQICGKSVNLKNGNSYHTFAIRYCSDRGRTFWTDTEHFEMIDGEIDGRTWGMGIFEEFAKYREILLTILCLLSERSKTIRYSKNEDNIVTRIRAAINKLSIGAKQYSDSLAENWRAPFPRMKQEIDDDVVYSLARSIMDKAKRDSVCPEYDDDFTGLYFERDYNGRFYPYDATYEEYTDDQMLRRKYGYGDWDEYMGDNPEYDEEGSCYARDEDEDRYWRENSSSWDGCESDDDDSESDDDDFDEFDD